MGSLNERIGSLIGRGAPHHRLGGDYSIGADRHFWHVLRTLTPRDRGMVVDRRASECQRCLMYQHMPELPLIDRIKIAAELVVPIVRQMEEELGKEEARAIVRRGASRQFRSMAREAVASANGDGGQALMNLNAGVRQGIDIVTEVRPSSDGFDMDVSDCVYARFFQELGEPELGFLLVCSADFDVVEEMDDVELVRSQTLMEGATHCDFQYRFLSP